MSKNIVITGASGFLGYHLLKRIKQDKYINVYAFTSSPNNLMSKLGESKVICLDKDDIQREKATSILKNSVVINCAYPRNSKGFEIADGLKYIQMVFETSVEKGAAAIINVSSQSVYSQQRIEAANEQTPVCLESPYAIGKYATELMLESICKGTGTSYTNLRMASLIGPGFNQRIVNRFVQQAVLNKFLDVDQNQQKFGFFDVDDAVDGIYKMIQSNVCEWESVYNFGRNEAYSLSEIADLIKKVLLAKREIDLDVRIHNNENKSNTALNANRFMDKFGFQPSISMEQSIIKILYDIEKRR